MDVKPDSSPSSTKPNRALSSEQTIRDSKVRPCPCNKPSLTVQEFGPCGRITESQRLSWSKPPVNVLVIKKTRDATILPPFVELVHWLIYEKRLSVLIEATVLSDPMLEKFPDFSKVKGKLIKFSAETDDLTDKVDFVISLGGDGTVLYANTLFREAAPPFMSFYFGSLGFLTLFDFKSFKSKVSKVLEGEAALTVRARLQCTVLKNGEDKKEPITVLNEVEVDRGPSPYLTTIEMFVNGKFLTTVQGDGVIVSSPTGSTAYAAAAGGSMVHSAVPAITVTPICPHSLSFRPIVVPADVELNLALAPGSHSTMWASFDGRNRQELKEGDSLHVTTSPYPLASVCAEDQFADWILSIVEKLNWNVREKQKKFEPSFRNPEHKSRVNK